MHTKKYDIVKVEFGDILVMDTVSDIRKADEIAEKYIQAQTDKDKRSAAYYIRPYFEA